MRSARDRATLSHSSGSASSRSTNARSAITSRRSGVTRGHGGGARLVREQRDLAEVGARPEGRDLPPLAPNLDLAADDHEELATAIAFGDQHLALVDGDLVGDARDPGEFTPRAVLEERHRLEEVGLGFRPHRHGGILCETRGRAHVRGQTMPGARRLRAGHPARRLAGHPGRVDRRGNAAVGSHSLLNSALSKSSAHGRVSGTSCPWGSRP